ncbi:MAG: winged helix-turn-helix transcriptional regulator [Verrucomicrobia bacterium]|nr:winged helix-turn-helix transcriptional regulator [Verrucomicrobiota bacterium]
MNKHTDLFKAFADETRVRILSLLAAKEQCVCELQATLQVPQPTISRHLAYLRRMGLVVERKEGKWVIYELAPAGDAVHESLLKCLRGCFQQVEMLKKDSARRGKIKSPRCCA